MSTQFKFKTGEKRELVCFACGLSAIHDHFCDYPLENSSKVFLYKCSACGSIQATGFTAPDYALEADGDWTTHYYCQVGAGLDFIIKPVFASLEVELGDLHNFLDVGSGFGFASHYAQAKGLKAVCIEPGEYGRIRSKVLGISVLDEYLTEDNSAKLLGNEKYDLVYSSEVIEHIPDPTPFINALKSALTPRGLIILTTPNADYMDDKRISIETLDSNALELIGYSQHCSLFSSDGMKEFLKTNSLYGRVISPAGGLRHRMVVVAGLDLERVDRVARIYEDLNDSVSFHEDYIRYLSVLKNVKKTSYSLSLGIGASFRLLGNYLNSQNLTEAKREIDFLTDGQKKLEALGVQNHIEDVFRFYQGQFYLLSGNVSAARDAYAKSLENILEKEKTQKTGSFYSSSWSASILVPLILAYSRTLLDLGDFEQARRQLDVILRPADVELLKSYGRVISNEEALEARILDAVALLNLEKRLASAWLLLMISVGKPSSARREARRLCVVALKRALSGRH